MKYIFDDTDKIKNVIFDLGNVLMDIDIEKTLNAFEKLHIRGLCSQDIHPYQKDFFLELELGTISEDEFIKQLFVAYPDARKAGAAAIWDAWNALLLDFEMERFDLLRSLSSSYRLFLLSNTNLPHRKVFGPRVQQLTGTSLESFFEKAYYSDEMKMRKPDTEIYRYVLDDACIEASETLFIDDNACNFSGAEALGIRCHHLKLGEKVIDLFK